jgi:hypothetical protein
MVLGTLTALSLRPIGVIEELVERLIAPARLVAEVAAPVRWWSQREARAAEESLKQSEAELVAEAKELLEEERLAARPPDHLVPAGLRIVHAEVIERRDGEEDSLIVRWSDTTELELGIPVVVGEHYIGRLAKLEPERGRGVVDLITGKNFFVGARLSDSERGSGELVVGGLAPRSEGAALSLAVHNPRVGEMRSGSVRVREWLEGDGFGSWGDGFLLGDFDVEEAEGEAPVLRVRPRIDLAHGLGRVVLLAAPLAGQALEVDLSVLTFEPECWRGASVLTRCTNALGRDGLRLSLSSSDIAEGSAVAFGPYLLGRVERAGWNTARVRTLSDPGLVLPLLARVDGEQRPVAIGRVTTLGRDAGGALSLRWESLVGIPGEGESVSVQLFTGGGVRGVPRGLMVGRAVLPREVGTHRLLVEAGARTGEVQRAAVWSGAGEEGRL